MAATEHNSAKRYGVRYGRKLREKIGKIEQIRRETNACPYCNYGNRIRRIAAGIWLCGKCNSKFTGRAYYIGRKLEGVEKVEEAQKVEEAPEPEQEVEEEETEESAPA